MNPKTIISISEARRRIFEIAEEVQKPGVQYTLTDKGKSKLVILSADEYESLMETLEITSDPAAMARIQKAEQEYERGEYVTWEELKKELRFEPALGLRVAEKPKEKYSVKIRKSQKRQKK